MKNVVFTKVLISGTTNGLLLLLFGFSLSMASRVFSVIGVDAGYSGFSVGSLSLLVLVSDLRPLGLILGTLAFGWLSSSRVVRVAIGSVAVIIATLYCIDLCIYMTLGFRLLIQDFFRYGSETSAIWSVGKSLLFSVKGIVVLLGWLIAISGIFVVTRMTAPDGKTAIGLGILAIISVNAITLVPDPGFVNSIIWRDFFAVNTPSGVDTEYSEAFQSKLKPPSDTEVCEPSSQHPKSVILVVIESLSLYHSQLQSGLSDSIPELDKLAQSNSYLQEFHANGFTTDGGLISLLTGYVPLPNIGRYMSVNVWTGFERSRNGALPSIKSAGYGLQYFGAASLDFLDTGRWLTELGFDHIEGPEHPKYENLQRGSFGDPGDSALYDRYLDWYDKEKSTNHNFSVIQTISTHPPFVQPGALVGDEFSAFRAADRAVTQFVSSLKQRGFFENGVLVITGDHRSMTPRKPGEWVTLGKGSISRLPAVVVGYSGHPRGPIEGRWQQTDFLPSLLDMVGLPSCTNAFQGRFLGSRPVQAKYILHAQGAARDRVAVWTSSELMPGEIQLAGDNTRWTHSEPNNSDAEQVLSYINSTRSKRPKVLNNFADFIIRSRVPK